MKITRQILQNLVLNEVYSSKVIPYIKADYFDNPVDRAVFVQIKNYVDKYNTLPTTTILEVELDNAALQESVHIDSKKLIKDFDGEVQDLDWLVDTTEAWCKERAIYNGLLESLEVLQDKSGRKERGSIVTILEDALSVSFDPHIGHDYLEDFEKRFEYYHKIERRIPFDLTKLNTITGGGLPDKSLMVIMGGVGTGKTAAMCHMAASNMIIGKNVLYITLEMAEERIAERIDANLLDVPIEDLKLIEKEKYDRRISAIRNRTAGKLIIKEYPTAGGNTTDFRHLLHELKYKRRFKPDIIYIDYLNICSSSRVKLSANIGMYSYIKSVAEEIRGFAVECRAPIITATQLNRDGYSDSDPGMEHVAESFGLPATADLIIVLTASEEMANLGQIQIKQIKNRFGDVTKWMKFLVGRDLSKMRLFDLEDNVQSTYHVSAPLSSMTDRKKLFADFK